MMITGLHQAADFARLGKEISPEYLDSIFENSPEYLLDIVSQIVEALLRKINVPDQESARFAEQIKERHMGKLFENFEPYDVQATRREARAEGRAEGKAEGILEGEAKGILKGEAKGILKGEATAILMLLEEIGEVSDDLQQSILDEKDMEVLNNWLKLAAKAETVEDFRRNVGI